MKKFNLIFVLISILSSFLFSSCTSYFDLDYRLNSWEKLHYSFKTFIQKHNFKEALKIAHNECFESAQLGSNNFRLALSLCDLALVESKYKSFLEAKDNYSKAFNILSISQKNTKNKLLLSLFEEDKANILVKIADINQIQRQPDRIEAIKYYEKARKIYENILESQAVQYDDSILCQNLVRILAKLAQTNADINNQSQAMTYYDKAISLAYKCNYPEFLINQLKNSYLDLLTRTGNIKERFALESEIAWNKHTNDGLRSISLKSFPESETYFLQAYKDSLSTKTSTRKLFRSLLNLANLYIETGQIQKAIDICTKAQEYKTKLALKANGSYDLILTKLINIYIIRNQPHLALKIAEEQLEIRQSELEQNNLRIAEILAVKSNLLVSIGKEKEAQNELTRAYRIIYPIYCNDRSSLKAMEDIASLSLHFNKLKEAEYMYKQIINLNQHRKNDTDARLLSYRTELMVVYCKQNSKQKISELADEIINSIHKADNLQKYNSYKYLLLILSLFSQYNLPDESIKITNLISKINTDLFAGNFMDEKSKQIYDNSIKIIKAIKKKLTT